MTETDPRIVYGAQCKWWDSVSKAATRQSGEFSMPCCPHCGGMLFQVESWKEWMDAATKYEDDGHPGYVAELIERRGKCDRGRPPVRKPSPRFA